MTTNRVPYEDPISPEPKDVAAPPNAPETLKWAPQPMVKWFDPLQLASTGIRALLSSIFGSYADKRELQAALSRESDEAAIHDYSNGEELWIDFAADTGDGFDSTYTAAWLLAQRALSVPGAAANGGNAPLANDVEYLTQRGNILVLGGDQVYPTASREEYTNRFSGPFEAALPWVEESQGLKLFAVPGNHDWYDGLTSFMRLCCQQRWIGGWKTEQTRSYFALKLPKNWWLLGIDIQLGADVDKPQLDYFSRVAEHMQPGDQVILCTAQPAWVEAAEKPAAYDNLAFFERTVLCPRGAKLMATLTGDMHHYARYSDSENARHKITSGGGGAYLYGTHLLPENVELPKADAAESGSGATMDSKTYRRKQIYPEALTSRRLRSGALLLGFKNPGFAFLLGIVYAWYAWLLQDASRVHLQGDDLMHWLGGQPWHALPLVATNVFTIIVRTPILLTLIGLFIVGLYLFCAPDPGKPRWWRGIGVIHGLAHVALLLLLTWGFAWINLQGFEIETPEWQGVVFLIEMLLIASPLGAAIFGLALLPGVNFNEAYSSQHLESYKNFLRLHIGATGELTIYPIGINKAQRWKIDSAAQPGAPYFCTRDGKPPAIRLIEVPIKISGPTNTSPSLRPAIKDIA